MTRIVVAVVVGVAAAVPAALHGGPTAVRAAGPCARRVISMAPHATETLFALGAGETVVGVDDFSREPPAARDLPRVGAYIDPDLEGIVALDPDLVVLAATQAPLGDRLGALGLPSRIVPDTRLPDVFATIAGLGQAVCRPAEAWALERRLRDDLAAAAARHAGRRPIRAALVVDRPAGELRQFYVAGPENFLDDVLRAAGAENVFADAPNPFPQVSLEPIAAADPELILELVPGADAATAAERVAAWRRVAPGLRAVRAGAVYALTETWLPVPGPSLGRAVERLSGLVDDAAGRRGREEGGR